MNEEEVEWRTEGEAQFEDEGDDSDPEQVRPGREDDQGAWDVGVWFAARSEVECKEKNSYHRKLATETIQIQHEERQEH